MRRIGTLVILGVYGAIAILLVVAFLGSPWE